MVCVGLNVEETAVVLGAYKCGQRRVYIGEVPEKTSFDSMDFHKNFLDPLSSLEQPRYHGKAMFRIVLNEFNPFIGSGNEDDQVFYSPSLSLNLLSDVVYGLSVKMYIGEREHVFYCSQTTVPQPSFRDLREMETFSEDPEHYPRVYVGIGGFSPMIMYSLFYLNEEVPGEFSRVVMEDSQQFLKTVSGKIVGSSDTKEFIERLINYKRNTQIRAFEDSVLGLRKCLGGLGFKK
jgi:hypothetical protein